MADMRRILLASASLLLLFSEFALSESETRPSSYTKSGLRRPSYLSKYDLATPRALHYWYLVRRVTRQDECTEWTLLSEAEEQFGEQIEGVFDSIRIRDAIANSIPISDQRVFSGIADLVHECCEILHLPAAEVYVIEDVAPRIYTVGTEDSCHIVLTSRIVELFGPSPRELRFVVGRELGRELLTDAGAGSTTALNVGSQVVLTALSNVSPRVVTKLGNRLPRLSLGHFCSWTREAEFIADRAGLLCCQDIKVAFSAMSRLVHGVEATNNLYDQSQSLDVDAIIRNLEKWEDKSFAEFVTSIRQTSTHSRYLRARLASLRKWHESGVWQQILRRTGEKPASIEIDVKAIMVKGIATGDDKKNIFVVAALPGKQLFKSTTQFGVQAGLWVDFDRPFNADPGQPIYFEIWRSGFASQTMGFFSVEPQLGKSIYSAVVQWNFDERSSTSRVGSAKVKLRITN